MKVDIDNNKKEISLKVGDILEYKNPSGNKFFLIYSDDGHTGELNHESIYFIRNLNGTSVWNPKGNTKKDILKLIELDNGVQKIIHYSQDEFKLTLTKI